MHSFSDWNVPRECVTITRHTALASKHLLGRYSIRFNNPQEITQERARDRAREILDDNVKEKLGTIKADKTPESSTDPKPFHPSQHRTAPFLLSFGELLPRSSYLCSERMEVNIYLHRSIYRVEFGLHPPLECSCKGKLWCNG